MKGFHMNDSETQLIYFKGCPNTDKARDVLKQAGISFEEVQQDELPSNHPFKGYSSPTILRGGEIIIGAKLEGEEGGCSLETIDTDSLKKKLSALGEKD